MFTPLERKLIIKDYTNLVTTVEGLIRMFEKDQRQSVLGEILELIDDIYKETASFSFETAEAIREARTLLGTSKIDSRVLSICLSFSALFGRGLQYISLERII